MTGFFDGLFAVVIATILNLAVVLQIGSRAAPGEARFLVRVYSSTVLLRYGLAIFLNAYSANSAFNATFWGDSESYDIGGNQIALRWSGEPVSSAYMLTSVSGYGWVYFVGAVYYLVGRNQLLVQFLNGLLGGADGPRHLRDCGEALRPCRSPVGGPVHGLLPADGLLVGGHVQGSCDPSLHRRLHVRRPEASERLSLSMTMLFILSELVLITLRFYIAYFVAFAGLATFLFTQRRGGIRSVLTYGLLDRPPVRGAHPGR